MKPTFLHRLEYGVAIAFFRLAGVFPYAMLLAMLWPLAKLAWWISPKLRKRTLRRMQQVFGGTRQTDELMHIGWIAFRNLVFLAVETIRIPKLTPEWVEAHMDTPSTDVLRNTLAEENGLIVVVPHMGNWELAGIALAYLDFPVLTFFRRQKNPLMTQWLYQARSKFGFKVVDVNSREIAGLGKQIKQENCILVVTPDVRAKKGGYAVQFLGHETQIPSGVAHYARVANCPVITAEVYRIGWTKHAWRQTGIIYPDRQLTAHEDGKRITQYMVDRFSESIMRYPECYFWFNGRWVLGPEKK